MKTQRNILTGIIFLVLCPLIVALISYPLGTWIPGTVVCFVIGVINTISMVNRKQPRTGYDNSEYTSFIPKEDNND